MVNYGRASKDCLPCRKRKLRCDLVVSGCSQCVRAKLTCHGYRHPNDVAFRDETQKVTRKAMVQQMTAQLMPGPQYHLDEIARNVFLSLYVGRYSKGFDSLGSLLALTPMASHLWASVDAVSLAFMVFQSHRPDLHQHATRRYLNAIQSLRAELDSSQFLTKYVVNNTILQSVLLLDLYEKMNVRRNIEQSSQPDSWLSHVSGALHMVQVRPKADLFDPTTVQLAMRTTLTLTISCGAAGIHVPEALAALRRDLDQCIQSPKWKFIDILSAIIDLRADRRASRLRAEELVQRARELDMRLRLAESNIPHSWRPRRISAGNVRILNGYYHLYPCHYATQVFNAFRIMRLDLNCIIRDLDMNSSTSRTILEITQDVCASVPQFLPSMTKAESALPLSPLQILQCNGVLTPLYTAAQMTNEPRVRGWVLQTLSHMSDNGVKLAADVTDVLLSAPETDYWRVFTMVGSCSITA
ncbi:hypothetical protein SVAN01_11943 [Stagonosporopsis vannaccii]|nr:hypothetical protein SVAN01_11943 [Stagonosporopsis vannaccii]